MARKKKQYDDDDGRVISPMNVDGMPWYVKNRPDRFAASSDGKEKIHLTKEEERAFAGGVFKATFLIAAVYVIVFTLFILFCYFVWFR